MAQTMVTMATLLVSVPDGMNLQQAFQEANKQSNMTGVDFVLPMRLGVDMPLVSVRILVTPKEEK
jgi:hypothetical protein